MGRRRGATTATSAVFAEKKGTVANDENECVIVGRRKVEDESVSCRIPDYAATGGCNDKKVLKHGRFQSLSLGDK